MKFADLHLHTIFSDGTYTPSALIEQALDMGINIIAITDHDTVDGILPSLEAARGKDIEIIPAIELTAEYDGLEIHILGYFIDYNSKALLKKLDFLKQNRRERMLQMVDKLNKMGIAIEAQEVFKLSGNAPVGRLHLARTLLQAGYVDSIATAFQKYIGERSPAYVCGFRLGPQEAIRLIKEHRGLAVLAHPYSMRRDDLIPLFIEYGLAGLEVFYPEHTNSTTQRYKNLAEKYNLLLTGGSDCHGFAKPEVKLGSVKLPEVFVEKLKAEKAKIK